VRLFLLRFILLRVASRYSEGNQNGKAADDASCIDDEVAAVELFVSGKCCWLRTSTGLVLLRRQRQVKADYRLRPSMLHLVSE